MIGLRQQYFEIVESDRDWVGQTGWRSADDVLSWTSDDVAAVSRSSDVVQVPIDPSFDGPENVFVKRYRYDRIGQRFKQMFRGTLFGQSRARKEFAFLAEMRRRSIPTVRPIAFGERRRGAFLRASFLITEGTVGFQSLDLFAIGMIRGKSLGRSQRRELVKGLATMIRQMHDAGVRHGGLFWRNILIRPARGDGTGSGGEGACSGGGAAGSEGGAGRGDGAGGGGADRGGGAGREGGFEFTLLDPDTHGRMYDGPVPEADAAADLAEIVASGMALRQGRGFSLFLKTYFQTSSQSEGGGGLSDRQRKLVSNIVDIARPLAILEEHRMAVTEAIEWFRARVAGSQESGRGGFDTLDAFFDALCASTVASDLVPSGRRTICFTFSDAAREGGKFSHSVVMEGGRLTVLPSREGKPDLVIRTDPESWLSVVSGSPDAYERVRSGRLRMKGDTRLLPALVSIMEHSEAVCGSKQ